MKVLVLTLLLLSSGCKTVNIYVTSDNNQVEVNVTGSDLQLEPKIK